MKSLILFIMVLPLAGFAKVSDFNSLINENTKAQAELQKNIKENTDASAQAMGATNSDKTVVLESRTYNAPTNRKALKFNKEIKEHRASSKKEMDRLAQEIKSVDREL